MVQLTEDASTLETLFAFVYPGVYPSLKDMPVEDFVKVAEAAEKYRVAPALAVCGLIIENRCVTCEAVTYCTYVYGGNRPTSQPLGCVAQVTGHNDFWDRRSFQKR